MIHLANVLGDDKVTRLLVVGDAAAFLELYCSSSASLREARITPAHWTLNPRETCDIDLGGMSWANAPTSRLVVDGDTFTVSLDHVQGIAGAWSVRGSERVPGWWRTMGWHWFYVMPVPTYVRVKAWLDELAESPATAAAVAAVRRSAEEAGVRRMLPPARLE